MLTIELLMCLRERAVVASDKLYLPLKNALYRYFLVACVYKS